MTKQLVSDTNKYSQTYEKQGCDLYIWSISLSLLHDFQYGGIVPAKAYNLNMFPRTTYPRVRSPILHPVYLKKTLNLFPRTTRVRNHLSTPPFLTSNPQQHPQPKYAVILIVSVSQKGSGLVCKYSKNATRVEQLKMMKKKKRLLQALFLLDSLHF